MEKINVVLDYKDRIFRTLFSDKASLLQLYNALNGTEYTDATDLVINDLEDAIYMSMKNDKSFILNGKIMNFYEHQSTFSPNLPLRGIVYAAKCYDAYVSNSGQNRYGSKKIKLPTPQFVVFYNGDKDVEDYVELRLSDMFEEDLGEDKGKYEWTAKLYNINIGHNKDILDKCPRLKEYSIFIGKVKECLITLPLKEAIEYAIDFCIEENVLREFLKKNRSEVMGSILTDYNEKETMEAFYKDGKEDGQERVNKLNQILISEKRMDDLLKASQDREYQEKLMEEYNI